MFAHMCLQSQCRKYFCHFNFTWNQFADFNLLFSKISAMKNIVNLLKSKYMAYSYTLSSICVLGSLNLVSRKIWMEGKHICFYTVHNVYYGNLLSHFFGKTSVKARFFLKKVLNRWFDEKNFSESKLKNNSWKQVLLSKK